MPTSQYAFVCGYYVLATSPIETQPGRPPRQAAKPNLANLGHGGQGLDASRQDAGGTVQALKDTVGLHCKGTVCSQGTQCH